MKQSENLEDFVRIGTQYLIAAPVNDYPLDFDPWACLPAWDVDTACKAITLSRMVDIEESRKIGNLESELKVGENPAIARHICTVYDRARIMADMAIKIGILNDPDTPANWINWAEKNGYSVDHLKFIVDPERLESFRNRINEFEDIDVPVNAPNENIKSEQNKTSADNDWQINARHIAKSIHNKNLGWSVEQLAKKTYVEMLKNKDEGKNGMTGRGGRVPAADTIKRHALTGIKS